MDLLEERLARILAQECTRLHQSHLRHLKTMTIFGPLPEDSDSGSLRWLGGNRRPDKLHRCF